VSFHVVRSTDLERQFEQRGLRDAEALVIIE
jgi:hypothetical protein